MINDLYSVLCDRMCASEDIASVAVRAFRTSSSGLDLRDILIGREHELSVVFAEQLLIAESDVKPI